jgi:hypothetical protein
MAKSTRKKKKKKASGRQKSQEEVGGTSHLSLTGRPYSVVSAISFYPPVVRGGGGSQVSEKED